MLQQRDDRILCCIDIFHAAILLQLLRNFVLQRVFWTQRVIVVRHIIITGRYTLVIKNHKIIFDIRKILTA